MIFILLLLALNFSCGERGNTVVLNDKLWFGMADGTVYKFDGKSFVKQF